MLAAAESDQQQLLTVNGKKKSKQLARLYRTRRKRFRHAVATFARQLVKDLYARGVSTIVIGELTGIRSNSNHSRQGNTMVHNYWSHKYVADRLRWTTEEYGMNVRTVSEAYTSQTCPRCGHISRQNCRNWRYFKCVCCGFEGNADRVASVNICRKATQATYPVTKGQTLPTGAPVSVPVRQDEEASWQPETPQSCKLPTSVAEKLTQD